MTIERIEDISDPRLDNFRNLKTHNSLRDARLFIAEGATVVERVLRSGCRVTGVVISDRKWSAFSSLLPDSVPVYRLTQELSDQLAGFSFHCGIMACAVRQPAPDWRRLLPEAGPSLIIAGDRIVDPENVGALIRIASAFGAAGVILGPGSADPFSRRVLRVSMGNVLFLPVMETADLRGSLDHLANSGGFQVCATTLDPAATQLTGFVFPERTILVFGNEFDGVSGSVASESHHRITISMKNGTDSLNVAVSAGIFAWQYRNQYP